MRVWACFPELELTFLDPQSHSETDGRRQVAVAEFSALTQVGKLPPWPPELAATPTGFLPVVTACTAGEAKLSHAVQAHELLVAQEALAAQKAPPTPAPVAPALGCKWLRDPRTEASEIGRTLAQMVCGAGTRYVYDDDGLRNSPFQREIMVWQ